VTDVVLMIAEPLFISGRACLVRANMAATSVMTMERVSTGTPKRKKARSTRTDLERALDSVHVDLLDVHALDLLGGVVDEDVELSAKGGLVLLDDALGLAVAGDREVAKDEVDLGALRVLGRLDLSLDGLGVLALGLHASDRKRGALAGEHDGGGPADALRGRRAELEG
jgi:hypothetical protein